ncbi:MAG TPA: hypothetical protein VMI56_05825 [Reyranella sp.]|nr:hypothetical protein [Reyranella sp.]
MPVKLFALHAERMTKETAPLVSALHKRAYLTPDALCYEYLANPDASRLYYGTDDKGTVAASQGWVGQTLIHDGVPVPSLMTERTLLSPAYWARADYRQFYLDSLAETAAATSATFAWGGTAALKAFARFGFDAADCFGHEVMVCGLSPILAVIRAPESWKWRAYHGALYGLSLAKHWLSLPWFKRRRYIVREEVPSDSELEAFMCALSTAHPDSYFMNYTRAKLAWFATDNPFKKREVVTLRRGDALEGLALVDDRGNRLAVLADCLLLHSANADRALLDLARHYGRRGRAGLYFWGNRGNSYIAALRQGLSRLGALPLRKETAQLVIRGVDADGSAHPPASALAMVWSWSPPL